MSHIENAKWINVQWPFQHQQALIQKGLVEAGKPTLSLLQYLSNPNSYPLCKMKAIQYKLTDGFRNVLLFHFMPLLNRPKAKWHSVSQAKQSTIIITQGKRDALSWQLSPKSMDDWDTIFSHIHILSQMSARSYCLDGSRPRRVDVGEKRKCSLGSSCMYQELGRYKWPILYTEGNVAEWTLALEFSRPVFKFYSACVNLCSSLISFSSHFSSLWQM